MRVIDLDIGQVLFGDLVERYVQPEIARRAKDGHLEPGVHRFQVLLPAGREPEVRLNEEVGGVIEVQAAPGKRIAEGQEVTLEDIDGITGYEPRPQDADVPHLTALAHSGGWSLVFELAGGHASRTAFLERAKEFLDTAREAAEAGRIGAFVDNAFSACELLAKAELLSSQPTIELVLDSGTHGAVSRPYHAWAKLGNTDRRFPRLHSQLLELRGPGRYLDRELDLDADSISEILLVLDAMEEHVVRVVEGTRRGFEDETQMFIAKRPLRAGQLVTSDDVTIYPLKKERRERR